MNQTANSSRIIRNTMYLYIKTFISMFVMLFVTRIVLNSLGVIDYGIYNVVAGSITFLCFFQSSLSTTMQRFLNHYQGENNLKKLIQVFNVGIVYHWAIGLLLVVLFIIFGFFLFNGILNIPVDRKEAAIFVYICLVVNTFFTIVTAPYDATITAHENMLFYSIVGILEAVLKLCVAIIILFVKSDKLIVYATLMMIIPLISIVIMRVYCKRNYEECILRLNKEYDKSLAKQMLSFAGLSLVGSSTNVVSNHGANIALNHFFGATINAVTGIANQIQGVLSVAFMNLMKAMTPVIFKSEGAGRENDMLSYSLLGCKYSTLLYIILGIPVFIEAPYLLKLWLIEVPEWTALFVRLQLIRSFMEQLGASLMNSLNASYHIKEINYLSVLYNLAPIVILIYLYSKGFPPYWHYIIMISIMVMGHNITMVCVCRKYCGLKYWDYFTIVLIPVLASFCSSFLLGLATSLIPSEPARFISCIVASSFAAILVAYVTMNNSEKMIIRNTLKTYICKIINNKMTVN